MGILDSEDNTIDRALGEHTIALVDAFEHANQSIATVSEQRFDAAASFIYDEMMRNSRSSTVETIRELLREPEWWEFTRDYGGSVTTALGMWTTKVAPHMDWDHKPQLAEMFDLRTGDDYFFEQPGTGRSVFYDIYSNIHYGYVGSAAGFDSESLIEGASFGETLLVGQDDSGDRITMNKGIELYERYGDDLTTEQLDQAIIEVIDELASAGADQVRYR